MSNVRQMFNLCESASINFSFFPLAYKRIKRHSKTIFLVYVCPSKPTTENSLQGDACIRFLLRSHPQLPVVSQPLLLVPHIIQKGGN